MLDSGTKPLTQRMGAVAREIAVIVAGVSLALGADALYDLAGDRSERARIIRSLDADLRLDSAAYASQMTTYLDMASNATSTLLALVEDPSRQASRVELGALVRESIIFPAGAKESATYREITATGSIGLIADRALREALVQYYTRPFSGLPAEVWAAYISDVNGAYEKSLRTHMGSGYISLVACLPASPRPEYEACLERSTDRLDLARLRSDEEFVEQLVGMTLWAGRFKVYVRQGASANRELSALVRDAIDG